MATDCTDGTDKPESPPLPAPTGSVKNPTMPRDMLRMVCQVEDTEDNQKSMIACVEAIRRIPFPGAQGFSVLKVEQVRPTLTLKMVAVPSRPEMAIKATGEAQHKKEP